MLYVAVFCLSILSLGPSVWAEESSGAPYNETEEQAEQERQIQSTLEVKPADSQRNNQHPIILVHGLGGFDKLYTLHYWGGIHNVVNDLGKRGYEAHAADIGTFSSNWDRACELYAQIKGGRVDYGKAHAEEHGHARYGRTYPGFVPDWGEDRKIHLISHSMGGQTVRVLIQLLENGDEQERANTPKEELSPLFDQQRKSWVKGTVTISTPHDGSPFVYDVSGKAPYIQQIVGAFAAALGNRPLVDYDFKLDQWGLKREPGESFPGYMKRVRNSGIWEKSKDTAEWDLRPEGALELNRWVEAQPDVYYFSVGSEQTYRSPLTGHELPEPFMNPAMYYSAIYIGKYTRHTDEVVIDRKWWKNDGLVSTYTMNGPKLGSSDEIIPYDGNPRIGKWNDLGTMKSHDHLDIIGLGVRDQRGLYRDLATLLGSLPE